MSKAKPNSTTSINDLIDNCLAHIFNYLPFADRNRIERICKHWLDVSQANWNQYSKLNRRLEFGTDTDNFPNDNCHTSNRKKYEQMIGQILQHRGPYLDEISFSPWCYNKLPNETLKEIVKFCPQIRHLHLCNLRLSSNDLQALAANCNTIESLSLSQLNWFWHEKDLLLVIQKNKGLRCLSIAKSDDFTGNCLEALESNILESLQINDCPGFRLSKTIVKQFATSLIELTIQNRYLVDVCYQHIADISNLRRLKLSLPCIQLDRSIMAMIASKCTLLESVELISPEWFVRNHEIEPILDTPCLRELVIRGRESITDSLFKDKQLSGLEQLILPCGSLMKESGIRILTRRLLKLKFLEICGCSVNPRSTWLRDMRARGVQIEIRGHRTWKGSQVFSNLNVEMDDYNSKTNFKKSLRNHELILT